jgi:hypothetical protein
MKALSGQHEKLVCELLSGKTISQVSKEMDINRTNIYETLKLPVVQARYNQLLEDIKSNTENSLFALYDQVSASIKKCLNSDNEQVSFKAAMYLLDKLDKLNIGKTDPEALIKQRKRDKEYSEKLEATFESIY